MLLPKLHYSLSSPISLPIPHSLCTSALVPAPGPLLYFLTLNDVPFARHVYIGCFGAFQLYPRPILVGESEHWDGI